MEFWRTIEAGGKTYRYVSLRAASDSGLAGASTLPVSLKILLENVLRHAAANSGFPDEARALVQRDNSRLDIDIPFYPARVLSPDSSGLPLIADLAAMRDAAHRFGVDPARINPRIPIDLVVDHSVNVDYSGSADAAERNLALEIERNKERYRLIRWAEHAFAQFSVVPPGNGICHQINLEKLARLVWTTVEDGHDVAFFDSLVGMDSHTPMVNSLGVFGWGVGGIEAATALLGEPIGIRIPEVIGCRLVGRLPEFASTTDLALTVTQRLRKRGVVGCFVEFFGAGARSLALPQRATLSNMAPEYGATMGLFAVDQETVDFLATTGRDNDHIDLVKRYAKAQGVWSDENTPDPIFTDVVEIDLAKIEPSGSGPRRPQDRVALSEIPASFRDFADARRPPQLSSAPPATARPRDGDVVIAAITSCTNTSNPSVMMEAGLFARNAVARGMRVRPWVKTSLAPGSRVVADYLRTSGLQDDFDQLGFNIVGFGCTTCMGNSGPLKESIADLIETEHKIVAAVLSGNRNFEGRVHNLAQAAYLTSPAIVVAYALAGSVLIDLAHEPLGQDPDGKPVYLSDIRPKRGDVDAMVARYVRPEAFRFRYKSAFPGPRGWHELHSGTGQTFSWDPNSTFIRCPPFLDEAGPALTEPQEIIGARALLIMGNSVTTDHISPVSQIRKQSSAGRYLIERGTAAGDLGSFMSRRVNHDVMLRGTFANPRLVNELTPTLEGGMTRHLPSGDVMSIDLAAQRYENEHTPLVVIAGADYGMGSSRDWAAKGARLLGIRAIIAQSFERIHRSNLVGMGILPFQFTSGQTRHSLGLDGTESFDIVGIKTLQPREITRAIIHRADGRTDEVELICRIDTPRELAWYRNGGIMPFALRSLAADRGKVENQ
jgi:aconitate hydratase